MASNGIFVGNSSSALEQFEQWLGQDVDYVRVHGGKANWTDFVSSLGYVANQFENSGRDFLWSVPLIVQGATLADGADGDYNNYYVAAALKVLENSPDDEPIYVRTGEEFNGGWFEWAAEGKEQDFIDTYRNFVDSFRSVSDRFVFEWNVNIGQNMDPATAYPGDDYVDIIGMDFYWDTRWDPSDPQQAWDHMVSREYGLQWLEDFAAAHGKPTAYSEWGVKSDDAEEYMQSAAEWFESHNVLYQAYWNSDSAYEGKLSDGSYPITGDAYREFFGVDDGIITPDPIPDPIPEPVPDPGPGPEDRGEFSPDSVVVELWDASTDTKVATITEGALLDASLLGDYDLTVVVTAAAGGYLDGQIGSVTLDFDNGEYHRIESVSPYALFGDSSGDYYSAGVDLLGSGGSHEISLDFHTLSGGGGGLLGSLDLQFTVGDAPAPEPRTETGTDPGEDQAAVDMLGVDIELWSAVTNKKVTDLGEGDSYDASYFNSGNNTIIVSTGDDSPFDGVVRSVIFSIDGEQIQIESVRPFAMFGDRKGDLWGGIDMNDGSHEVEIDFYSGPQGNGDLLTSYSLSIELTGELAYVEQVTVDSPYLDMI